MAVAGFDSRKALDSGAADEIEQDGLDGVITVVGYADGIGPCIVHDSLKISVTQFTGGHLN